MTSNYPPTRRDTCGSYAGYQAHRKANELVCDDCRAARNEWERDRRAARKQAADRAQLSREEFQALYAAADDGTATEYVEGLIADRLLRYT